MNRTSLLLASLPVFLLTACGGSVQGDTTGATTGSSTSGPGSSGSSTGTSASTGSSSGTSGAGGATSTTSGSGAATSTTTGTGATSTTSGTGASTSTGTGTGGGACVGSVDLVVGNAAPLHLTSDCASDTWNPGMVTTALGYLLQGGPPPGASTLDGFGCVSKAVGSEGLSFSAEQVKAPGMFTSGTATYTDTQGANWGSGAFNLTVTKLGAVGDTIEGSLTATVTHPPSQIAQSISATFKVCHIEDQDVP